MWPPRFSPRRASASMKASAFRQADRIRSPAQLVSLPLLPGELGDVLGVLEHLPAVVAPGVAREDVASRVGDPDQSLGGDEGEGLADEVVGNRVVVEVEVDVRGLARTTGFTRSQSKACSGSGRRRGRSSAAAARTSWPTGSPGTLRDPRRGSTLRSSTWPPDASVRVSTERFTGDSPTTAHALPSVTPDLFLAAGLIVTEIAARSLSRSAALEEALRQAVKQATAARAVADRPVDEAR